MTTKVVSLPRFIIEKADGKWELYDTREAVLVGEPTETKEEIETRLKDVIKNQTILVHIPAEQSEIEVR